jgi:hypothetical protein
MELIANQNLDVRLVPDLEAAIDRWLAARNEYKKQATDENQHAYNAAYFALGEVWAERYSKGAATLDSFEHFRRDLIAHEQDKGNLPLVQLCNP